MSRKEREALEHALLLWRGVMMCRIYRNGGDVGRANLRMFADHALRVTEPIIDASEPGYPE